MEAQQDIDRKNREQAQLNVTLLAALKSAKESDTDGSVAGIGHYQLLSEESKEVLRSEGYRVEEKDGQTFIYFK